METLKPCPFCGCENIRLASVEDVQQQIQSNDYAVGAWIFCERCEASASRMMFRQQDNTFPKTAEQLQADAIKAWNRRPDTTT